MLINPFGRCPRMMPIIVLLMLVVPRLFASTGGDILEIQHLLIGLVLIVFAAKLGGDIFARMGQPEVLGELVFGIILGNLGIFGIHIFDFIATDKSIAILAELGVIILLFQVGLESDISQMAKVGLSAFLVATVGVIVPFLLGWAVATFFVRDEGMYAHMFIGATLCATSVGLTARVLMDLGKVHTKEARIILGAAVIDDIQGLIVLTIIAGLIKAAGSGTALSATSIIMIILKAFVFLGIVIAFGRMAAKKTFAIASKLKSDNLLLAIALIYCFGLSAIASLIGLAPIVGAFAAGLIMDQLQWRDIKKFKSMSVDSLISPIGAMLVPVFFVRMGATVNVATFADYKVLVFAGVLTLFAILGKQACALGVLEKGVSKLTVGIGMIPRGEVGLIFAATGMALMMDGKRVINDNIYSAIVIMIVITTLVTPPLLKWAINKSSTQTESSSTVHIEEKSEDTLPAN